VTLKTVLVRLGLMLLGIIVLVAILGAVQSFMLFVLHASDAVAGVVIIAVSLGVYVGWVRLVERREPAELAPRPAAREVMLGLAIGLALFTATIGSLAALGVYAFHGFGSWAGVGPAFMIVAGAAVLEELLFRGWLFRTVRDLWGTWIAVGVSALVFGLLHAFNPGATLVSTIAIALEAGVLLSVAYAATNRLWLPIGLHAGWNFAEGTIFGTTVSGHVSRAALLRGEFHGAPWLTGGAFGPEASVAAVAVCLLAAAVFATRVVRTSRFGLQ
jgi:membrane protease YdiL (CAAX protease family)